MIDQTMRTIVPTDLDPRDAYRLLISAVVPRPIGWASTLGADGSLNLAPFSFFNAVSNMPLTVMISVGQRRGQPKDTLRNALETGEFVINIVDEELAAAMNITSGEWAYDVDEFDRAGLMTAPSIDVKPPRVAAAPIALECKVTQIVPVQDTTYTLILGRVLRFHVRSDLLRPNGTIDASLLKPVARLSGDEYATLGRVFEMKRPT
ncbi:MAG TPA: flavin reductase family protein [Anaerolineae bacterium]|nr:flavin reductase family protein [Anaerolineae bacterium]